VSARGGGHNVAGHAVCDDGMMIDLRLMREVAVDPVERVARVGGGATWNDFDPACRS
jgi:FAD/FMN-containing dehydrogenase